MRVLLISPPYARFFREQYFFYPLGLGYLGAALEARGHEVRIYNADHGTRPEEWQGRTFRGLQRCLKYHQYPEGLRDSEHEIWHEVRKAITDFTPELIGISVFGVTLRSAYRVAAIARQVDPKQHIVLGGPQATVDPTGVMNDGNIDFAVIGEGEQTLTELVEHLESGSGPWEQIAGIAYREDGEVRLTDPRTVAPDLDSIPIPNRRQLLGLEELPEKLRQEALGQIQAARGCPFSCRFCGADQVWGSKKPRWRSPEQVVHEACHLRDAYGVRQFIMWEDTFGIKMDRVERLCDEMHSRAPEMSWVCLIRANLIDDRMLSALCRGGCEEVQLGIESGSARLLDTMLKGTGLDDYRHAVDLIRKHRMRWFGFFIIGFPGETLDEMGQTLDLIKELRPDSAELSIFTPYQGTSYYDELAGQGKIPTDPSWVEHDTYSLQNYFGGTLTPEAFREFALEAHEWVDRYNAERQAERRDALQPSID